MPAGGPALAAESRATVSVIVPALDEDASIARAVRSALAAGADEVLVVDGGSSDGTAAAAREAGASVLYAERGRAVQMNAGAAASAGDILVFLHADTVMPPGAADAARDACGRGALGGAYSVELLLSEDAGRYRRAVLRLTGRMINLRARLFRAYTGDQGIFARRDVFFAAGRYPEIPLMEDVVLSRRITRNGPTALLRQRVATSARRWEARGPVRTILLMWGLRLAHRLGLSPARCASIYRGGRR